jgi:hypothetical protein
MRMEAVREFNGSTVNTYIRKEAYCDAHMPVERPSSGATSAGLRIAKITSGHEEESDEEAAEEEDEQEEQGDSNDDSSDAGDDEEEQDDEEQEDRTKRKKRGQKSKIESARAKKTARNNSNSNSNSSSGFKENKSYDHANLSQKKEIKAKMKKARKILAEKRSACPTVAIPTIPAERLTEIAQLINIPKRNQFLQRLLGYWTLKRESRNGVPLLRRLQLSNGNSVNGQSQRRQRSGRGGTGADDDDNEIDLDDSKMANDEETVRLKGELKELQRLRQDLERARILIELIRKREKVKRESIRNLEQQVKLQIEPFKMFLQSVLTSLKAKDTNGFFQDPVDVNEVPDYLFFIKNPMSYADMQKKVDEHEYTSFNDFEADFNQIVENCTTYNEKPTVYYKAAIKMRDTCKVIFKNAREKLEKIRLNEKAGVHLEESQHSDSDNKPGSVNEGKQTTNLVIQSLTMFNVLIQFISTNFRWFRVFSHHY